MDETDIQEVIGGKMADALAPEGEMVTRWVAVVETVDSDGKRWIRTISTPDATSWDNLGLLDYAHTYTRAIITASSGDDG